MINKLGIKGIDLHENTYTRGKDRWDVPTLIEYSKSKKYSVFKYPIEAIPLHYLPFDVNNMYDFIYQCIRINETDLKYPILIDDFGNICDGWHRIAKAIIEGRNYVNAIRLLDMPEPSGKVEEQE